MRVSWFDERGVRVTGTDSHPGYRAFLAKQAATRTLKNISVDRVDVVTAGANQRATIQLVKSEEPDETLVADQERLAAAVAENEKLVKRLRKMEKKVERTSKPADPTVSDGAHKPQAPLKTTPNALQGADVQPGQGQDPDIGPGESALGKIRDRLDDMVRRGVVDQPTASAMYNKARLAQAASDASAPYWTQSDSINKYLTPEQAAQNVPRAVNEEQIRKEIALREARHGAPISKSQGMLLLVRLYKELSQVEAAQAAGISQSLVSMLESGQVKCTADVAGRLADAYGLEGEFRKLWTYDVTGTIPTPREG